MGLKKIMYNPPAKGINSSARILTTSLPYILTITRRANINMIRAEDIRTFFKILNFLL